MSAPPVELTKLSFELSPDDLFTANLQLQVHRSAAWRKSRLAMVFSVAFAGAVCWPLYQWVLVDRMCRYIPRSDTTIVYLGMVLIAGLIAIPLRRLTPASRARAMDAWAARRTTARMAKTATLGPTQIALDSNGLLRTNAKGELRIAWAEILTTYASGTAFALLLKGRRVLVVPARAFPDARAAQQFREAVAKGTGVQIIEVGIESVERVDSSTGG